MLDADRRAGARLSRRAPRTCPASLGFAAALEAARGWIERAGDLRAPARRSDRARRAARSSPAARRASRRSRRYRMPGVAGGGAADPVRPGGHRGLGRQRLLVGQRSSRSHVLAAMGWDEAAAREVIRVSFGPDTSRADVDRFGEAWRACSRERRRRDGMIYLDYQATTPLAPEARDGDAAVARRPSFGNPHSPHRHGPRGGGGGRGGARAGRGAARRRAGGVVFTSGATEALNWAIKGASPAGAATGSSRIATEHAAVLDTVAWLARRGRRGRSCCRSTRDGLVDLDAGRARSTERPALVAAMLVNNEIGVDPAGRATRPTLAHAAGALLLCDAVQGYRPRADRRDGCDLIAISAHKIHGPKGIGALWVRDGVDARAAAARRRAGGRAALGHAVARALCAGFGAAAALARRARWTSDAAHVDALWRRARDAVRRRLDAQRRGRAPLSRQSQHPPRRARRGAADVRPARDRLLGRLGLRQRLGPAEPCAARDRPERRARRGRASGSASAATPREEELDRRVDADRRGRRRAAELAA